MFLRVGRETLALLRQQAGNEHGATVQNVENDKNGVLNEENGRLRSLAQNMLHRHLATVAIATPPCIVSSL